MTIADARAAIGWSKCELARRIGYSENAVRTWELGRRPPEWLMPWLEDVVSAIEARPAPIWEVDDANF
jgi:ribosome-binding protein aMBF1 (putative translation factor)